ncbi:hypothetical protein BsWGS_06352 [Bradybaena similaris]
MFSRSRNKTEVAERHPCPGTSFPAADVDIFCGISFQASDWHQGTDADRLQVDSKGDLLVICLCCDFMPCKNTTTKLYI